MSVVVLGVGDTNPPFHNTFLDENGKVIPLTSLSNGNFQMYFVNAQQNNIWKVGQGAWNITNATLGQADYLLDPADTNTPGQWQYYPVITWGTRPQHYFGPNGVPPVLSILNLPPSNT